MDNLLGHTQEVIPVSQCAASAVGQAASVAVPSIWAGSLLRARLGSSPACELQQITVFQMDYTPNIGFDSNTPSRYVFGVCRVRITDPLHNLLQG